MNVKRFYAGLTGLVLAGGLITGLAACGGGNSNQDPLVAPACTTVPGYCSGGSSSSPAPPVPIPAASVISISQTAMDPQNGTGIIIHFSNHYSDGHITTCTGMPEQTTDNYFWSGDCVPDGK